MTTDFSNIRTLQDVINVLSVVYFNMNEIERIYYDVFINPNPMDVAFQRYNDLGVLETITIPNRAKDAQSTLSGVGNPEGYVIASVGVFYVDEESHDLYYKRVGSDAYGWTKIDTVLNLLEGVDYLSPTGDASNLSNLNMSNAGSGVLAVNRGGTGSSNITGLIKGNGTSAFTAAVDGTDFLGPTSMTGIIAYYPVANVPIGWLRCDGSAYSRTTYARLFNKIGTTYGVGDGSTTFNVPNLYNYFIRGWDGVTPFNTVQEDQVGVHKHNLTGETETESAHTHTRGTMNIVGTYSAPHLTFGSSEGEISATGAFYDGGLSDKLGTTNSQSNSSIIGFDASRSWSGATSGGSAHKHTLSGETEENTVDSDSTETRVINKMLVPVIKF